jgi:hypothetical protein
MYLFLISFIFGKVDKILKVLPKERRTSLFSATMTTKVHLIQLYLPPYTMVDKPIFLVKYHSFINAFLQVQKLQRASLQNPVKVEVATK